VIGQCLFDHGHPLGEVVHGVADLVNKVEEFGEGGGVIRAGLAQNVGAFALAGDHQSLGDELPNGIPCGHHRDAIPRGQLSESGQLVTGVVGASGDRTAQVVGDALVGRSGISVVHLHGPIVPRELAETDITC
jgi:hypothetical protein